MKKYITGTGQSLTYVHNANHNCFANGCVIHNPSDHCMRDFPTHWRSDRRIMERICPHGVGHPDPDDLKFRNLKDPKNAEWNGVHGCCGEGCCGWVPYE